MRKVSATNQELQHVSVLLDEVISFVPARERGFLLDVTAGAGGHFFSILRTRPGWTGECWDRDPDAEARVRAHSEGREFGFQRRRFGDAPAQLPACDYILADIGVSSFQLDDPSRGLSFKSEVAPDFRMDPTTGLPFRDWLRKTSEIELTRIFENYGEEPKAKRIAKEMKSWGDDTFTSARVLADRVKATLGYNTPSRTHPATRVFQALRIAVNDELGELERLLAWAPRALKPGGRLAIISFHSLEDRIVKNAFRALAASEDFVILTKKPLGPQDGEEAANPRARSAKLRVIEKGAG
ncbi:MAG: 16S rRNA (cytosine(1402)-N(4))-methyltransferase RsmH [Bdellovibrionales bacterium]|nr:16S rRNA (cytosine(1402)-N(4))-methyltransferase RsmH [Bdellovibrionales bacterium]